VKLKIADNLSLPLDAVTQTFAILAKRRAGKSYTARRFAEELLGAAQQVVIVDPKGDWWGIRSSADGKSPGFPVIVLGGEHGDLPLEVTGAEVVAKLAVYERVNLLLDLSTFRKSEVARFMGGEMQRAGFLESLYRLKSREDYRSPLMLVVDEADAIAPQKPFKGEERMLGAIEDIVRRGGQRGIGCLSISQRSAVLNKNILTQTQCLVAMRTISPQDLDAMNAWIDVHGTQEQRKILMESLPSLPTGDAWFWSPGWPSDEGIFKRVHVSPITTFDSGATPKPGEKLLKPKTLADIDLDAVRRQMAETIERVKAEDPRELRKQIAALKAELAAKAKEKPGSTRADLAAAEAQGFARGYARAAKDSRKAAIEIVHEAGALMRRDVITASETLREKIEKLSLVPEEPISSQTSVREEAPAPAYANYVRLPRPERKAPSTARPNGIPRPQQAILDGLAWLEAIGIEKAQRNIAGFLAGASPRSSAFMNNLSALRTAGLIGYPSGGSVILTPEGRKLAESPERPPTSEQLHSMVYQRLPRPQGAILAALIEAYPGSLSRDEAASRAGASPNSSAFMNNLSALRSIGLVDYPAQGQVVALPLLFLNESRGAG
jgi:hypothetical protein